MSTFKRILESKSDKISQKDMKRLQRAAAAETPEQAKEILKNLESTQERVSRKTRKVPSAKPPGTVEQTPLNKYIRGEAESGRRVSQELRDTAGIRDAERRGYIKPEKAGETKPSAGATNRARARGAAARQGVDISPEKSRLNPRGRRLADTTKGGPVKTFKPAQPAPAPKPETVKKPVPTLSKRGALSKKVDPVLKGLRKQGALERRMSAAVDSRSASSKELADKASKIIKDLRTKPSAGKPTAPPASSTPRISTNPLAAEPVKDFSDYTKKSQRSGNVIDATNRFGRSSTSSPPKPTAPPSSTVTVKQSDSSIQQRNYRASQRLQTAKPTQSSVEKIIRKTPDAKDFAFATNRMQKVDKAAADRKLVSTANKELQSLKDPTSSKVRSKSMKTGLPPAAANKTAAVNLSTVTTGKDTFKPSRPDLGPGSVRPRVGTSTLRGAASKMTTTKLTSSTSKTPDKILKRAKRINAIRQTTVRSPMGRMRSVAGFAKGGALLDAGLTAGLEIWDKSQANKAAGGSGAVSTKDTVRAAVRGLASSAGYVAGGLAAAPIAAIPLPGARPAAVATGIALGSKASDFTTNTVMGKGDKRFNRTYDTIAGFSASQKNELAKRNRQSQSGTKLKDVTNITGNKGIVRGKDGKETVGYAAKYTNPKGEVKTVFKRAADPSTLRYTSSNPLERLGRGFASTNLPGAGFVKDRYKENDAEVRRKKVAALKALSMKESVLSEGMIKNIEKMINRILRKKPKVKTPPASGGSKITTSGGEKVGSTKVTGSTDTSSKTKVTGSTNTSATSSAASNSVKTIKNILKKPAVKNTGIGAAVLGGAMLVGDQLTKDSPVPQGDSADSEPEKGPVLDTPDGPKQFPPLKPLPSLPNDETKGDKESTKPKQYVRRGHWRAINDPPQFHRRPALDAYRNIRSTKKNY